MAEQHGNRWYPTRYTIGHRKLLLDPKKSPMENLFWLISVSCGVWLAKYRVYAYSREAVEELEQELRLRTFLRFRDHVWRGTFRKDLSLYLNVRSAAWGVCSNTIKLWHDKNVLEPSLTIDIDAPITGQAIKSEDLSLGDTLATHKVAKLRTHADTLQDSAYKYGKRHTLDGIRPGERGYTSAWIAITESEWDYYLQSCDEYGLEPISKEEFIRKNFPEDGRTSPEKLRNYKREWARKHKQTKKEQG